jgi:pyroglutamyl-peptidase
MILVTGFEPFTTGQGLILKDNPTGPLAEDIARHVPHAQSKVLPVSFQETRRMLNQCFDELAPTIWLGLGFAPHRTTVDIECVALNIEHCIRPDNDGERPFLRPIIENGPLAYETQLDASRAIDTLTKRGISATVSLHAGTFLCNQTFYLGCHRGATVGTPQIATFIHVPPLPEYTLLGSGIAHLLRELSGSGH